MADSSAKTPGSQDLATFQIVVQQQEGVYGPLKALATQGSDNLMTFLIGPSPDTAHRAILNVYSEKPPAKPGYVLVCSGTCLISGVSKSVAAYRKTP